jgi:hypothetical protein
MNSNKRANELGNKFYQGNIFDYDKEGHLEEIKRAKERTKICVQEILNVLEEIPDLKVEGNILLDKIEYYKEVLAEVDML